MAPLARIMALRLATSVVTVTNIVRIVIVIAKTNLARLLPIDFTKPLSHQTLVTLEELLVRKKEPQQVLVVILVLMVVLVVIVVIAVKAGRDLLLLDLGRTCRLL